MYALHHRHIRTVCIGLEHWVNCNVNLNHLNHLRWKSRSRTRNRTNFPLEHQRITNGSTPCTSQVNSENGKRCRLTQLNCELMAMAERVERRSIDTNQLKLIIIIGHSLLAFGSTAYDWHIMLNERERETDHFTHGNGSFASICNVSFFAFSFLPFIISIFPTRAFSVSHVHDWQKWTQTHTTQYSARACSHVSLHRKQVVLFSSSFELTLAVVADIGECMCVFCCTSPNVAVWCSL